LSPSVGNLTQLENLNLFDNDFKGKVPLELEKLSHLKKMNISYNLFSGLVSNKLSLLDKLNMTMRNEMGSIVSLPVIKE
jgi:Leucine-rich repeat (LRR) protein